MILKLTLIRLISPGKTGNSVTSITLLINNEPAFVLRDKVTLDFASGFVIAAAKAMRLLGIMNYDWTIDGEKQPVTAHDLSINKMLFEVPDDERLAELTCDQIRKPSYIVWIKSGLYRMHRFDRKSEVLQFIQGVLTACNSFNIAITEVIARQILRTRFVDGRYTISYFNVDGYELPSYNLSEMELTALCNVGVTTKSFGERLNNLRVFLQNRWQAIPNATDLIEALLVDMSEIIKYIDNKDDIETLETYLGFSHKQTGPETVRKYLEVFGLE